MTSRAPHFLAALACALSWACGSPPAPAPPPSDATSQEWLHYVVKPDRSLSHLEVDLCFRGLLQGPLIAGRNEAGSRLRSAHWVPPAPREPLRVVDGRIMLPASVREACLHYQVSLHEGGSLNALVTRTGEHVVASPNAWLWRPYRRSREIRGVLQVQAPRNMAAALPWSRSADGYLIDASAFAFDSHAAFGSFRPVSVDSGGVRATAALLGEVPALPSDKIRTWLADAVQLATLSDGEFPARNLSLVVLPAPRESEPFGSIARGGGASVLLFVPARYTHDKLQRDWVLPHELSHLLLPFVQREDAWLPEGLATYYQEVLRARAGLISDAEALDNIASALRSALREDSGRSLCDESRSMHQTFAYRSVYWAGAAHWLNVDVSLRERFGEQRTLDTLLRRLRDEARLSPPYSARELLTRLDQLSETKLFSSMLTSCQQEPFPAYEHSLQALGLHAAANQGSTSQRLELRKALFSAQRAK